jgi:hypothetical protein
MKLYLKKKKRSNRSSRRQDHRISLLQIQRSKPLVREGDSNENLAEEKNATLVDQRDGQSMMPRRSTK